MRQASSGVPGTSRQRRPAKVVKEPSLGTHRPAAAKAGRADACTKAGSGVSDRAWTRIRKCFRDEIGAEPDAVFVIALRRSPSGSSQSWTCEAQGKQFVATDKPGEIDRQAIELAAKTLAEFVGRKVVTPFESDLGERLKAAGASLLGNVLGAVEQRIESKINGSPSTERSR